MLHSAYLLYDILVFFAILVMNNPKNYTTIFLKACYIFNIKIAKLIMISLFLKIVTINVLPFFNFFCRLLFFMDIGAEVLAAWWLQGFTL